MTISADLMDVVGKGVTGITMTGLLTVSVKLLEVWLEGFALLPVTVSEYAVDDPGVMRAPGIPAAYVKPPGNVPVSL
jgi:hypothetical protein